MRIISERGTNLHIFPMINTKGKSFDEDYVIKRQDKFQFIGDKNSRWDDNCYRVMDYIASVVRHNFDEFCFKQYKRRNVGPSYLNCLLLSKPEDIVYLYRDDYKNHGPTASQRRDYSYSFTTTFNEIMKHPCIKGMQQYIVKEAFQKINNFKFKADYKIKTESVKRNDDGSMKYDFSTGISNFDSEFQGFIKIVELDYDLGLNNKKYNQKIQFQMGPEYNCPRFSVAFLHNILTGGYQAIKEPEKFYSLSKYANILYRLRFLQYSSINTNLKFSNIMDELCLSTNNITNSKKKFKQIIEELSDNGYFKSIKYETINKELYCKVSTRSILKSKPIKKLDDKKDIDQNEIKNVIYVNFGT